MHSFKVIVSVAPNGAITMLYPGSISDKSTVQQSGLLNHLTAVDLVLAKKGFLILDLVPTGASVNIPPFLTNGHSLKVKHGQQRSQRNVEFMSRGQMLGLKIFKILSFIPSYLCCHADIIFQLCASLGNLQFPLIKEGCEGYEFE